MCVCVCVCVVCVCVCVYVCVCVCVVCVCVCVGVVYKWAMHKFLNSIHITHQGLWTYIMVAMERSILSLQNWNR